jgi:hypothetical protein
LEPAGKPGPLVEYLLILGDVERSRWPTLDESRAKEQLVEDSIPGAGLFF